MYDPQAIRDLDMDYARLMGRPRHKKLFICGIAMLALWFPVAFGGLVNFWQDRTPVITTLLPNDEVALVVLLLWGLPGIPAVLLGYYGWRPPAIQ